MAEVWVVIDEGCQECGIETEPLGIFLTEVEAEAVADAQRVRFNGWRDGGQACVCVYKMELPAHSDGRDGG